MIAVIQCAATKRSDAGRLVTAAGKPVVFVADPAMAPPDTSVDYARPGDKSDGEKSWRQVLLDYNRNEPDNPLKLMRAWRLYSHAVYERLVTHCGVNNVYILSAGWGLISASFLTPEYDITFSSSADGYKRRAPEERWGDFNMLPDATREPVIFFGGKAYLPLFVRLTAPIRAKRTVFYNSKVKPDVPGCDLRLFKTARRTNWQYECASAFIEGTVTAG